MKLQEWLNRDIVAERLFAASMGQQSAELAAAIFRQSAAVLLRMGSHPDDDVIATWVPGRIEVFGKHTDYCGGHSLLAAAERGFAMLSIPASNSRVRVIDAKRSEVAEFTISPALHAKVGHWVNYPLTVARRLVQNFPEATRGADIAFSSNLPESAGMSSSSALLVGVFLLLTGANRLHKDELYRQSMRTREDLAGYLGTVENGSSFGPLHGDRGVGTFGGSEDHTAILCAEPGGFVLYSFCPVRYERSLRLAKKYTLAVAASGIVAEKTGAALAKYNRLAILVKAIVETWKRTTDRNDTSLAAILSSAPDAGERLRQILRSETDNSFSSHELVERLDHFEIENQLVKSLPDAIDTATVGLIGTLAARSHEAATQLLKNQTRETSHLVELATRLGASAASAFGAGFGGSVWALIEAATVSQFLHEWQYAYGKEFPRRTRQAVFFTTRPGPPAVMWPEVCFAL